MIRVGKCSNTNFPTLKMPKNAKKEQSVTDRRTDGPTDRPNDTVTYRSRYPRQKAFNTDIPKGFFLQSLWVFFLQTNEKHH